MGAEMLTNGYHSAGEGLALNRHVAVPSKHDAQGWVVQKFGGTSVGKFAESIADGIVRCVARSLQL